ncbi:MAG TPA: stage II sporulation protein M [Nitriliruptorales bacterium]|nr:stage II sporulation protein M [Nitriliruptorales bacterium]
MDIDRFIAANEPVWARLDRLTERARRGVERLEPDELDELVRLYLRVSSHLSTARTTYRDPGLAAHLSGLVGRAGTLVYGSRPRTWRTVLRFATSTFPAAVWHSRAAVLAAASLFTVAALTVGLWIARSPAAYEAAMPTPVREAYLTEDFEAYYSSQPAAQFASWVFTNNVRVAITAFAGGIALCLPTAWVLLVNGAHVGVAAGLFAGADLAPRFWGLILPHGLLELTAVFIAGGVGLRLGWAVIDPGDHPRRVAVAEQGRRAVVVVAGLVGVFLVAALLEAVITPSPLPTWGRVGVGVAVETGFVTYLVVQGRLAAAEGRTGALGELDAGWVHTTSRAAITPSSSTSS